MERLKFLSLASIVVVASVAVVTSVSASASASAEPFLRFHQFPILGKFNVTSNNYLHSESDRNGMVEDLGKLYSS